MSEEGNPQVYNAEGQIISDYQDESLTEDAVKFMGVTQPKWYGALTNNFSYKGFDFSFMLVYNFGHKMRRDVNNFCGLVHTARHTMRAGGTRSR